MAEQNIETVKQIYAAWEHGDFSSTDWADPEIEYSVPARRPPSAECRR
jgi:ketosteroid isomerase-like protein